MPPDEPSASPRREPAGAGRDDAPERRPTGDDVAEQDAAATRPPVELSYQDLQRLRARLARKYH
jgi:hypothetical protein